MASKIPACPPQLKTVQHYLKMASDYENRNIVISYWARLYALETSLKIDCKTPEAKALRIGLMTWLESFKKQHHENEAITSDVAAQAVVENEAHKLFTKADAEDRAANFNKNTVKMFYTAGILFDICEVFGELTEEVITQRKYSKWKATYIHNCLKSGETPVPGPAGGEEDEFVGFLTGVSSKDAPSSVNSEVGFSLPPIPDNSNEPFKPMNTSQEYGYVSEDPPKTEAASLTTEQVIKAQKFCKYAISALDYEDSKTAIDNLQKALALLTQ